MEESHRLNDPLRPKFVFSAGLILAVTGVAKLGSFFSPVSDLDLSDPVFLVSSRIVMAVTGLLEVILAAWFIRHHRHPASLGLIATVTTLFSLYRFGVWLIGAPQPCACLGRVGMQSELGRMITTTVSDTLFFYLLGGSLILLLAEFLSAEGNPEHSPVAPPLVAKWITLISARGWVRVTLLIVPSVVVFVVLARTFTAFGIHGDEGLNFIKAALSVKGYSLFKDIWSDQPPFLNAVMTTLFKVFGEGVLAPRVFVALLAAALVFSVAKLASRSAGLFGSCVAALCLISSPHFFSLSASVLVSPVALALATLAALALPDLARNGSSARLVVAGVLYGLALQTKMDVSLLLPAFVAQLALAKSGPVTLRSLRCRPWLLWCGSAALCFLAVAAMLGGDLRMLLNSHLSPQVRSSYRNSWGEGMFVTMLGGEWIMLLPAMLGIIHIVAFQKWGTLFPVVWFVTELAVRAWYRPFWEQHFEHIAVPLAWLAGIGAKAAWDSGWALFRRGSGIKPARALVALTLAVGWPILAVSRLPPKMWDEMTGNRSRNSRESWAMVGQMRMLAPQTCWVFTDDPIYAFHAGLLVPPDLAVVTFKRFSSGQIDAREFLRKVDSYRPEQIVVRWEWTHRLLGPYLKQKYTHIGTAEEAQLWIRKDLSNPYGKPRI